MAWTDEARAAAAEARKAHGGGNKEKASGRDVLAKAIKNVRAVQGKTFHGAGARLKSAKGFAKGIAKMHGLKVPKFTSKK
jgi:hypothetical protein